MSKSRMHYFAIGLAMGMSAARSDSLPYFYFGIFLCLVIAFLAWLDDMDES